MISSIEALRFSVEHFPEAPEKLAAQENVEIRESMLTGCDGWCLQGSGRKIIRLNKSSPPARKRFTLAHELSHLILGIPAVCGETVFDRLTPNSVEEREVDALAASLLIPTEIFRYVIQDVPIVSDDILFLANLAKVSIQAAAVRACNLAKEVGVVAAAVCACYESRVEWEMRTDGAFPSHQLSSLLAEARVAYPNPVRRLRKDGLAEVVSITGNGQAIMLFAQVLPADKIEVRSKREIRKNFERQFIQDTKFRDKIAGIFGAHKKRIQGMPEEDAVSDFWHRYSASLEGTLVDTGPGREYVRIRIRDMYINANRVL